MEDDHRKPAAAEHRIGPGTRLNDIFEIDEKIASGGMGEVFRGRNLITDETVAIKIVLGKFAKDERVSNLFFKEARILSSLNDPSIVRYQIFTVDKEIGRPYLVMEYVSGISLSQRLVSSPLSVAEVRILTAKVAAGLETAHAAGVIHRDMSPDNILLVNNNVTQPKIIDFGIARSTQPGDGTLLAGQFAGRENFASPEQFGLFGGRVEGVSDVYSLALVVVNALQGEPLDMMGSQYEMIQKRMKAPDLGHLDPELRPIIEEMLVPDPAARRLSMRDVANYFSGRAPLESLVRNAPVAAPDTDDFWQKQALAPDTTPISTTSLPTVFGPTVDAATVVFLDQGRQEKSRGTTSEFEPGRVEASRADRTTIGNPPADAAPQFDAGGSGVKSIAWESMAVIPPTEPVSTTAPRKRRRLVLRLAAAALILIAGAAGAVYFGALNQDLPLRMIAWFKGVPAKVEVADAEEPVKTPEITPTPIVKDSVKVPEVTTTPPIVEEPIKVPDVIPTTPIVEEQVKVPDVVPTTPIVEEQVKVPDVIPTPPIVEEQVKVPDVVPTTPIVEEQVKVPDVIPTPPIVEEQVKVPDVVPTTPIVEEQVKVPDVIPTPPIVEEQIKVPDVVPTTPIVEEQVKVPDVIPTPPIVEEQVKVPDVVPTTPIVEEQVKVPDVIPTPPIVEEQVKVPEKPSDTEIALGPTVGISTIPAIDPVKRDSWLAGFDAGSCLFAAATGNPADAGQLLAAAASDDPFRMLEDRFSSEFGVKPQVNEKTIDRRQCATTTFLRELRKANIPELQIGLSPADHAISGSPIDGKVSGFSKPNKIMLVVDNDGMVYNFLPYAQQDRDGNFGFQLQMFEDETEPKFYKLLILIASDQPLPVKIAKEDVPMVLGKIMPRLSKAIRAQGSGVEYAYAFFRIDADHTQK